VPRYLGYAWKAHPANNKGQSQMLLMDTSFATPGKPWSLWRPAPGSAAIGTAAGLVAHDALLGRARPVKASRGAVEPAYTDLRRFRITARAPIPIGRRTAVAGRGTGASSTMVKVEVMVSA
jgi:hypothetical protein